MTKRKNNKKALIVSALSLLLCVSMLVGSTMAWFTDNATTGVNKIESGTLDLVLEMKDENGNWVNAEGKTLQFLLGAMAPEGQKVLWEPGATYELPKLRISNAGNLALKFDVDISGIKGDAKLNEAIDWTYTYTSDMATGADSTALSEVEISKHGEGYPLLPANEADQVFNISYAYLTISGTMKKEAGNEYQGLSMDGVSITVKATQYTYESDSNNHLYDVDATYDNDVVVTNQDQLNAAIANTPVDTPVVISLANGTYTLPTISSAQAPTSKNITFEGSEDAVIEFTNAVTMADCTIAFDGVKVTFPASANYIGLQHTAKVVYKDCVIEGQQTMYAPEVAFNNCTFVNTNNAYCVWTYGATNANFSNCTFATGGKAILVYTESETHATIGLDKCIFNDNDYVDTKKGAVEIGSSPYSADTTYNIYMNGCTVNGFAVNDEGISTGSAFWGNKNSMDKDHLNVVIDGVDVY